MFWSGYPWWKHLSSPSAFTSHAFAPPGPPVLSENVQLRILTYSDSLTEQALLERVCIFLYDHFATPQHQVATPQHQVAIQQHQVATPQHQVATPQHQVATPQHQVATPPRLVFQPDTLLPPRDHLLVLEKDASVLGTIRYHFIGHLHNPEGPHPIYLVDAFCLHPDHRGKGWGSVLLANLHAYANREGIPHALFLKEGACLPVLPLPMYSGRYAYRRLDSPTFPSSYVRPLTSTQAWKWIDVYRTCQPQTLLVLNSIADCHWRVYHRDRHWVLACFQDTHQRWITKEGRERMGWCTVWLESPDLGEHRQEASLLLSDSVSAHFDWIWTNRKWTNGAPWKEDGGFHWYTYQWTTNLSMEQSYALMA